MSSPTCTICNAPNSKNCAVCGSSAYCSVECQRTDWPLHKLLCLSYKAFIETRPSPAHKLAILFPVDSKIPELRWIECELRDDPPYEEPLIKEFDNMIEFSYVRENVFREFELANKVVINNRDCFQYDGSVLNQCIFANTKDTVPLWKGPVLAFRSSSQAVDGSDELFLDMRLTDLRYAIDFFQTYTDRNKKHHGKGTKVRGVRANCVGEQQERGLYESVAVPRDHPFGPVLKQTSLIGLPVQIKKYQHPKSWKGSRVNLLITSLHMRMDPDVDGFYPIPVAWQSDVGSVLIVRADGKDLDVLTAEVLCSFAGYGTEGHLANREFWGHEVVASVDETKRFDVPTLLSTAFEKYFQEYRKKQIDDGKDEWKNAVSPFDNH